MAAKTQPCAYMPLSGRRVGSFAGKTQVVATTAYPTRIVDGYSTRLREGRSTRLEEGYTTKLVEGRAQ